MGTGQTACLRAGKIALLADVLINAIPNQDRAKIRTWKDAIANITFVDSQTRRWSVVDILAQREVTRARVPILWPAGWRAALEAVS